MAERVGVVGLGLMGQAFTTNMRKAGVEVQGFDVEARRMDELRAKGGEPVDSPAAAARGVDWVVTSLPNSGIVRDVVLGENGIASGAAEGMIVIDTTTSRPEDSVSLHDDLAQRGIGFLDAAVSGTSLMAQEKDLIIIAGGSAEHFEACQGVFDGFSRAAYYMGPSGSGALTKLIINMVLLGNRFALMEGMLLGMKAGVDNHRLLAVLKDGASGSKAMDQKGEKLIAGEYSPQGAIAVAWKDIGLMLEQGRLHGSPMLMTSTYAQILGSAAHQFDNSIDSSSAFEILRELGGLESRVKPVS